MQNCYNLIKYKWSKGEKYLTTVKILHYRGKMFKGGFLICIDAQEGEMEKK